MASEETYRAFEDLWIKYEAGDMGETQRNELMKNLIEAASARGERGVLVQADIPLE
jgi:hypothetical protein